LKRSSRKRTAPVISVCKATSVIPVLVVLAALCACHNGKLGLTDIRDDVVPLPKDMSPTAVFTTTSPSLVIKGAADKYYRSLFSWEPDKAARLLVKGRNLEVTRLSDDVFATWYFENSQEVLVTLNAQELTSRLLLPEGGPAGWQGCAGDTHYVVCIGDPGMKAEDPDFDEMAFSAVLVVDIEHQKATWFPVKHQTYFHPDLKRRLVSVIDNVAPSTTPYSVNAFDLSGKNRGRARATDILPQSPSGRFAESLQEDGDESWELYDAASKRVLLAFNCDRPECKVGDREDHMWNPAVDGQVVALDEGGAYGKGGTCSVYQCLPPQLVKRVSCGGLAVYDWSRDGRELVTIEYEGGKLRRERVN